MTVRVCVCLFFFCVLCFVVVVLVYYSYDYLLVHYTSNGNSCVPIFFVSQIYVLSFAYRCTHGARTRFVVKLFYLIFVSLYLFLSFFLVLCIQ